MAVKSRNECVYLAKVAESAERYAEMLEYVKGIVAFANARLTVEERSLLSVAYKNQTGGPKTSKHELYLVQKERAKIESEIGDVCQDVLQLLTTTLIPAARPGDETVFYYKMKGDYYRYLAELARDDVRREYATSSLDAYKLAYKLALGTLEATHPTRLGLALNFAVYYRDVLNSPERACHLAKHAFDEAVAMLDQMPEATYRDSLLILQLLRDDLMLWFKEIQERDELEAKAHN
ncbi:14-3-3 protein [Phellopilus nigrolimitatus]|nr:14-3-3 protein [Phellopilus nigrolimitatus]